MDWLYTLKPQGVSSKYTDSTLKEMRDYLQRVPLALPDERDPETWYMVGLAEERDSLVEDPKRRFPAIYDCAYLYPEGIEVWLILMTETRATWRAFFEWVNARWPSTLLKAGKTPITMEEFEREFEPRSAKS